MRRSLIFSLLCVALGGCPKADPPAEEDRALRILQGEKAKQAQGQPLAAAPRPPAEEEDPNAKLARIAAQDGREEKLRLPVENATVHLGTLAVKLLELSTARSAGSGKIKLSTEELFLKARLVTQNVGKEVAHLDFGFAQVECGQRRFGLARDVTRAAGTRELKRDAPGDQREEVVLYFELPPEALNDGCALLFPAAAGGPEDVRIKLD